MRSERRFGAIAWTARLGSVGGCLGGGAQVVEKCAVGGGFGAVHCHHLAGSKRKKSPDEMIYESAWRQAESSATADAAGTAEGFLEAVLRVHHDLSERKEVHLCHDLPA